MVRERQQGCDPVELGRPAQLDGRFPLAEEADGGLERAGQVLDAEGVGVAGSFKGGAFVGAVARARRDLAGTGR